MTLTKIVNRIQPSYFENVAKIYIGCRQGTFDVNSAIIVCPWCGKTVTVNGNVGICDTNCDDEFQAAVVCFFKDTYPSEKSSLGLGFRSVYGLNITLGRQLAYDPNAFTELAMCNPFFFKIMEKIGEYELSTSSGKYSS